ncbi:PfkB family carbohydrate kinase [Naasia sp. SYSU D00948]|uniref:carbohydrate kinase family protein n=1 Tax=Naasia sp. SYSU D00948 TaxID=2817379 RepID=UPI001B30834F|nr:PfkB family carbohydrate kinase [Naasia sp. SYSU D00948]
MRILVVGDVIDDVLVRPSGPVRTDTDTPARIERRPGGSAANVAAWLGALGRDVDFVGTVFRDDVTRHRAELEAHGVHAVLHPSDEPTGTIVLVVDGQTRTMFTQRGANRLTGPDSVPPELLAAAAHLHLTGYSLFGADGAAWRRLLEDARAAGLTTSVDPSSAAFLADSGVTEFVAVTAGVDVLLPNLDEGRLLTGLPDPADIADALLARHRVAALTLGPAGAEVCARGGEGGTVPAAPAPGGLVDPTGAGDAFAAGFLSVWVGGGAPLDAAREGARVAAEAVSTVGARPAR